MSTLLFSRRLLRLDVRQHHSNKVYHAKKPRAQRDGLCHFDRREKSFLDHSHSLGMTNLARHLAGFAVGASDRFPDFTLRNSAKKLPISLARRRWNSHPARLRAIVI